jgi:hypothetical protein
MDFKTKYGSTNYKEPNVIFIEGSTYISPTTLKNDYKEEVEKIKKTFVKNVKEIIGKDTNFSPNIIRYLNVSWNGIKMNKKSYLTFEIYLRQNETILLKEIKPKIEGITLSICEDLKKTILLENFNTYRNKIG